MNVIKVLLIGAEGQLGKEFQNVFKIGKTFIGDIPDIFKNIKLDCVDRNNFDVTDEAQVEAKISQKYDYVINCSAYTAVDKAEEDIDNCKRLNEIAPLFLAKYCKKYNSVLVHFSTDYVYGGDKCVPYLESDDCYPETVYGLTKRRGELNIINNCDKYFIFRTAWLYGKHGKNFVYKMMELSKKFTKLTVVNDQFGSPTYANDLVYNVLKVIQLQKYGLYNCSGEGKCSWFDFAKEIFRLARIDIEVQPVNSNQYPTLAKRPKYSVMENAKLKNINMNFMREWKEALKDFFVEINLEKGEK